MALAKNHGRDVNFCFNRKEAKTHGEGGNLVGAPLKGRVLVVDDVITAGTASTAIVRINADADPLSAPATANSVNSHMATDTIRVSVTATDEARQKP